MSTDNHSFSVLAIIPARGGSKGIWRKNLRMLHGRPLLDHALETASSIRQITNIVVSTDDPEIADHVNYKWNVTVRHRPAELGGDDVPLDPVIYDALTFAEEQEGKQFDTVVVLQPTAPTLRVCTLRSALSSFLCDSVDSYIAGVEDRYLKWEHVGGHFVPIYKRRVNRQLLPLVYRETGGFTISCRRVVTRKDRFGENPYIWPLAPEESIDIDTELDWYLADALLARGRILLVVTGNRNVGMGHIYRALSLADALLGNDILFAGYSCSDEALALIDQHGHRFKSVKTLSGVGEFLRESTTDIVINDLLDTEDTYVRGLRSAGCFVVNFEDLGRGSMEAHLVFNALYEYSSPPAQHRFGHKYVCLAEHYLLASPVPFRERAETLLITFGGIDENNLTLRTCKALLKALHNKLKRVDIVVGPGFEHRQELEEFLQLLDKKARKLVCVHDSVANMARIIRDADIAVTSNGRTVYELAAMGVPAICISQNDRETLHLFSRYSSGLLYLGIAPNVDTEAIENAIHGLLHSSETRRPMRKALLEDDLRSGVERVKNEILSEYRRWKDALP